MPTKTNKKKFSPVGPIGSSRLIHKKDGSLVCSAQTYGYIYSKKSSKNFTKLGFLILNYRQKKLYKKYKLTL